MRRRSATSRACELPAWLASTWLVLAGHALAAAPPVPVALNPPQQRALQGAACSTAASDAAIEYLATRERKTGTVTATVRCPLAARVAALATFQQRGCTGLGAREWTCDAPLPGFRLPVGTQQVPITYEAEIPALTAASVADLIGRKYGYTFNGRNLALIVRGQCHVSNDGPGVARGMVNYLLRCGDDGVIVTRACHQQACRLFPSALFDPRRDLSPKR